MSVLEDVVEADVIGGDVVEVKVVAGVVEGCLAFRPSVGQAGGKVQVEILEVLMRLEASDSGWAQ